MSENFKKLFKLEESVQTRDVYKHSMNFRTTVDKNKLLDEEIELLAGLGIRMSKNDLINYCIDIVLGYKQHPANPTNHYRGKEEYTLPEYIEEHKEELMSKVMERLFEKEMKTLERTIKSKKDKKAQIQALRRIHEKREEFIDFD